MTSPFIHAATASVFTRDQLKAAFDLVADGRDWKSPIDAVAEYPHDIPKEMFETIVREAVVFFTGSVPTFERGYLDVYVRVVAIGYYLATGA